MRKGDENKRSMRKSLESLQWHLYTHSWKGWNSSSVGRAPAYPARRPRLQLQHGMKQDSMAHVCSLGTLKAEVGGSELQGVILH